MLQLRRCALSQRGAAAAAAAAQSPLPGTFSMQRQLSLPGARLPAALYASVAPAASGLKSATLEHGVHVVAADGGSDSGACVVSLAIPAGPRHETVPELGLAHHLKNWAFQDSEWSTGLAKARETEIRGGTLSATLTREHLFLTAECLRKDLRFFVGILQEAAYRTKFQVHEASSVAYLVSVETKRALNDPDTLINEALHRVAFRNGLGNSLFASARTDLDVSTIKAFGARQASLRDKVALITSGVPFAELERNANVLFSEGGVMLNKGSTPVHSTKYYGGEDRLGAPSSETGHLAIAYPTGAAGSPYEAVTHVLKAYLGGESPITHAGGSTPLAKLAAKTGGQIMSFSYTYSDAGLFGFRIRCEYDKAQATAAATVAEMKKIAGGIPENEFKRAVAVAKTAILRSLENKVALVESLGAQVLGGGKALGPTEVVSKLEGLKPEDVTKCVNTMLKSKPSFVAYGNTLALPYADSL